MNAKNEFQKEYAQLKQRHTVKTATFYRIYKTLILSPFYRKNLSDSAILLYSIMLDRKRLSATNGWVDKNGEAFIIYTIDEIQKDLDCSKVKALSLLNELENKDGMALIQRSRKEKFSPSIIRVRPIDEKKTREFVGSEIYTSSGIKNIPARVQKTDPNKNKLNKNEINKKLLYEKSEEERYTQITVYLQETWENYDPFKDERFVEDQILLAEYMRVFKEKRREEKLKEVYYDLRVIVSSYLKTAEIDGNCDRSEKAMQILQDVFEHCFFDTIQIRKLKELGSRDIEEVFEMITDYLEEENSSIRNIHSYIQGVLKNKIAFADSMKNI